MTSLRWATSGALALLAGALAYKASATLRFAMLDPARAQDRAHARRFVDVEGVRFAARAMSSDLSSAGSLPERVAAVESLVAVAPLSSAAWLRLATLRRLSQDRPAATRAFDMSLLAGPNEGAVMPARAAEGVALWADLSSAGRRAVVADLRLGWKALSLAERLAMAVDVAALAQPEREALRAAIRLDREGDLMLEHLKLTEDAIGDGAKRDGED